MEGPRPDKLNFCAAKYTLCKRCKEFTAFSGAPNNENPNLFSIGEGFGFFVFFGKQNEGSFPTAVCPKPYQKKDRITKVTTVKVP
jgi:hypothetical protein